MITTDAGGPRPGRAIRRRPLLVSASAVAVACVLLAALAGCSSLSNGAGGGGSGGGSSAADSSAQRKPAAEAPAPGATGKATGAGGAASGPSQASQRVQDTVALPRALIRTAELTVRVDDLDAKAGRVAQIARAAGGDVYGDNREGSGDKASADIVVKVDPDRLEGTLSQIAALGKEEQRSSSTQDVTEQVADVDARVATMRASIARVRALLSRANSVGDLVAVEGELSRREADLESLQARQRALAAQTSLATVTVHLVAKQAAAVAPPPPARHGFTGGLARGWDALTAAVGWLATAAGAVLPFAVLVLLALIGWRIAVTRIRRPRPATPASGPVEPTA